MAGPRNILLVGFMASGKTETGKALARITGWPLVDADAQIVARAGRPIDEIFRQEGEPAFRVLEAETVRELCAGSGRIIAAGGGAFTVPENRERMLAGGIVICLSARPETIHRRITEPTSHGKNQGESKDQPVRPLLAGDNPLARIRELLTQRAPAYAQAHFTVETDVLTPERVARRILELCGIEAHREAQPVDQGVVVDLELHLLPGRTGEERLAANDEAVFSPKRRGRERKNQPEQQESMHETFSFDPQRNSQPMDTKLIEDEPLIKKQARRQK